jgi:tetratricopeptide (TPR) repeat protein
VPECDGKCAPIDADDSGDEEVFHDAHFPAEEEAQLLKESHEIKSEANQLFIAKSYDQAISCYDRALASCPSYLDYDVAIIHSNIAACHLKLEDWKAAVDSATVSIERLSKIIPPTPQDKGDESNWKQIPESKEHTDAVVELSGDDEEAELKELQRLQEQDEQRSKVMRLRGKVLMRRAKAKTEIGGWGSLQGAAEDYQALAGIETLPADDKRVVQRALRELPERIKQAREKEMGDMMGKLKELGNGILSPFGLSTDNFKFVQDPKTGGYNMNFQS